MDPQKMVQFVNFVAFLLGHELDEFSRIIRVQIKYQKKQQRNDYKIKYHLLFDKN
jgi:hypothetical protein